MAMLHDGTRFAGILAEIKTQADWIRGTVSGNVSGALSYKVCVLRSRQVRVHRESNGTSYSHWIYMRHKAG